MNRSDKVFTALVLLAAVCMLLMTSRIAQAFSVENAQAVVSYRDKEVLRLNMTDNGFHTVHGELGDVVIEINDGRIRVAEEISPRHYCSLQGWVDRTNTPIVCLPNRIVIVIESSHNSGDDENGQDIIVR